MRKDLDKIEKDIIGLEKEVEGVEKLRDAYVKDPTLGDPFEVRQVLI